MGYGLWFSDASKENKLKNKWAKKSNPTKCKNNIQTAKDNPLVSGRS